MVCSAFPGPGDRHIYTFNPMAEFIHPTRTSHVDFEFDKFKNKHNKNYMSHLEHERRKEIFRQNARYIFSKNRQNLGNNFKNDYAIFYIVAYFEQYFFHE